MKPILAFFVVLFMSATAHAEEATKLFSVDTAWNLLGSNHKIEMYSVNDPIVNGVACWFAAPRTGGISGDLGLAEDTSDISLACRQVGPISFNDEFEQASQMFEDSRSFWFKEMQIVRGCDPEHNTLVYLVYSDKLIDGSPKNSTSVVPLMPWGDQVPPSCSDFLDD